MTAIGPIEKTKRWIWGKLFVLFFRPLYALEHTETVTKLVNRDAVRKWRSTEPSLTPIAQRILATLKTDGIATTNLNEFFGDGPQLLAELSRYSDEAAKSAHTHPVKSFVIDFFDSVPLVTAENPFIRLALDERTLGVAAAYLGMAPKLQEFALAEIKAVPEGADRMGSMRWHRDPHDRRLLKMFIYLSEVGPENGPFTYLRKSNAGNEYANLFPQVPPAGIYPPAKEVEARVKPQDIFSATGAAGTIVFADTAGLHQGGYVLAGRRRMATTGFLPPKSFLVRMLRYKKGSEHLAPLQEYALFGSERLPSRSLYKMLKGALVGKESLGTHITGQERM